MDSLENLQNNKHDITSRIPFFRDFIWQRTATELVYFPAWCMYICWSHKNLTAFWGYFPYFQLFLPVFWPRLPPFLTFPYPPKTDATSLNHWMVCVTERLPSWWVDRPKRHVNKWNFNMLPPYLELRALAFVQTQTE